jgi:pyruvyltransferase
MEYTYNNRIIRPNNVLNWGDLVPFKIIQEFSKTNKITENDVFNVKDPGKMYKIISTGSVMLYTNEESIVWGTGCIRPEGIGRRPKKIYAVRGPLTREELLKRGIDCPEIYGDPALLFPKIYNPEVEKKYEWGIIPHYIEYESAEHRQILKNLENEGVKIIDICSGEKNFINEILEVKKVVSSSLHGLIMCDAYGIPNARVNISNKLIGGHFKFKDYYMSVGREIDLGLQLTKNTKLKDLELLNLNTQIIFDFEKLLSSGPWNFEENKNLFYR